MLPLGPTAAPHRLQSCRWDWIIVNWCGEHGMGVGEKVGTTTLIMAIFTKSAAEPCKETQ